MTFKVGEVETHGSGGTFVLWRDHFDGAWSGRDEEGRPTVICFDRGVGLGIRVVSP